MVRITSELLRSRAEHNEGQLSNLEEIALHQFEIEKIEVVGDICRNLTILLLQNNIINKIGWCELQICTLTISRRRK